MSVQSRSVANLVQGVSQQASQQRRDSQCAAQYDCVNSPKDGCVARPGGEAVYYYPGIQLDFSFAYEFFRGRTERYLVLIRSGTLTVLDLISGAPCAVTVASGFDGRQLDAGLLSDRDAFVAQSVDDFTFIANKSRIPAMRKDILSPGRPKEALVFFKSGGYLTTYTISVLGPDGVTYRWIFSTPDNSAAANASYIQTNYLAAVFYKAMSGTYPGGPGSAGQGTVGSTKTGEVTGSPVSSDNSAGGTTNPSLGQLGFAIAINGNLLRIWRPDGADFKIDTSDSVGDTYLNVFKDTVKSFSELPKGGFDGFTLQVKAKPSEDNSNDFWVEYIGNSSQRGYWTERTAPSTPTTLDVNTMPFVLRTDAPGQFTLLNPTYSTRICGDGIDSAKDPSFIGKPIQALFYHKQRLAILTEGGVTLSKSANPFTFFPDTVQTLLASAPIDLRITAAETVALLRKPLKVADSLFVWAQGAQFSIASGQDPFRQDTVSADESTAFEFSETANFAKAASSVYFASEPGAYATIRNLTYTQGRPNPEVDVTAHVPSYIPCPVRYLKPSDTGQFMFVTSDDGASRNLLYLYNYLVQDRQVVQSAWNVWRLPAGQIIWCSVFRLNLTVLLQRPDGMVLLTFQLNADIPDDDAGAEYRTRLDLRVSDLSVTGLTSDGTNSTFTLPFALSAAEAGRLRVVTRGGGVKPRGREFEVLSVNAHTVTVQGDLRGERFYVGLLCGDDGAKRRESTFFLRGDKGIQPTDRLTVRQYLLNVAKTGTTDIVVSQGQGRTKTHHLNPGAVGVASPVVDMPPILADTQLVATADALNTDCAITLVNDSWLPSRWQTAEWRFEAVIRNKPAAGSS